MTVCFLGGHILETFWRDTAAFIEAQEQRRQQEVAHWLECWTTIARELTYSGSMPWAGGLDLAEWARIVVEQYTAVMLAGCGEAAGSRSAELLERLGQVERQIKSVEKRLDLLTEHVQGARRKGRGRVAPRRRPPSP